MMHHDAITGTHRVTVGLDYKNMIDVVQEHALTTSSDQGVLAHSVTKMAAASGLKLEDLTKCELEGSVVECHFGPGDLTGRKSVVTVHNPNIESQHGFFLRVPKLFSRVRVGTVPVDHAVRSALREEDFIDVKTETFCLSKV